MSTSYYRLKKPVTYLQIEQSGGNHVDVGVWVNHAKAGTLCLRKEEVKDLVMMFAEYEEDDRCPLRTHWAGIKGSVVRVNDKDIADEEMVISAYGDLLTVAKVKARQGAKRQDGMPTELFGYEDRG